MDVSSLDISALGQLIINLTTEWGLKVLGALALLVIGRILAGRARSLLRAGLGRANIDPTLIPFISSLSYWTIMAMVGVAVLGMIGVQTASLLAVFGAAGLAIGLAMQGTLSNLAAGVMLLIFRPFNVDEFVDVGGTAGTVKGIGLFTTVLHTPDNVKIVMPNSQIFGGTIKNFSANATRRVDLVIGISYDDDINLARETILAVLAEDSRVLEDPAPVVEVGNLGDSSVDIFVRPWVDAPEYWVLKFHLLKTLKERLTAAGCNIPYPQRDVHLYQANPDS